MIPRRNSRHPERSGGSAVDLRLWLLVWLLATPGFAQLSNPDAPCASCHQAIYTAYQRTTMARGSGQLVGTTLTNTAPPEHLEPGIFDHRASGIRYQVSAIDGHGSFRYQRPGGRLQGQQTLEYWIGAGLHGRTYLYQIDGTWFELPINYYSQRRDWEMAPNFDRRTSMPANLPTDPGCLHCHATSIATPVLGTRSRYMGAPFAQGGIGCSACHGDPTAHLAAMGHGPIVNPGKLDPGRRDSACLACHLEGDAVIYRAGRSLAQFQPGEDLADSVVYYVRSALAGGGGRSASQYEALLTSACKRAAGDKLTCTTCHDPHSTPAPEERVAYYRGKCLACHASPEIARDHYPDQPDCARCHMPSRLTTDISHEQNVDHNIQRVPPAPSAVSQAAGAELVPVGNWRSSDRELGLAYAQMAGRGDRAAGARALRLLARAEAAGASDAVLHAQLGFLRQANGEPDRARAEYQAALAKDPWEPIALGNLAILDATSGRADQALSLLHQLVDHDPTQTAAGLNLAFIECRLHQDAAATLALLARYNPDDPMLTTFLATGNYAGQHCDLHAHEAAEAFPQ